MRNPREVIDDVALNLATKVVDRYLPLHLKTPKTKRTSGKKESSLVCGEVYPTKKIVSFKEKPVPSSDQK